MAAPWHQCVASWQCTWWWGCRPRTGALLPGPCSPLCPLCVCNQHTQELLRIQGYMGSTRPDTRTTLGGFMWTSCSCWLNPLLTTAACLVIPCVSLLCPLTNYYHLVATQCTTQSTSDIISSFYQYDHLLYCLHLSWWCSVPAGRILFPWKNF